MTTYFQYFFHCVKIWKTGWSLKNDHNIYFKFLMILKTCVYYLRHRFINQKYRSWEIEKTIFFGYSFPDCPKQAFFRKCSKFCQIILELIYEFITFSSCCSLTDMVISLVAHKLYEIHLNNQGKFTTRSS